MFTSHVVCMVPYLSLQNWALIVLSPVAYSKLLTTIRFKDGLMIQIKPAVATEANLKDLYLSYQKI